MKSSNLASELNRIRRTSSGCIIFRPHPETQEWLTLILRSWDYWDFPKGQVEDGENMKNAAIREVFEETGISDLQFPWGSAFACTSVYSKDKIAYYCVARTETIDINLNPNPVTGLLEHEEFRWIPWSDTPQYLSPRLYPILDWASAILRIPCPETQISTETFIRKPSF